MSYELEISYNFLHLFPLRMSFRRAFRRIAQGDKDRRFQIIGQLEEVAAPGSIEIADPARAQSLFGSGETDMLNGDSDVWSFPSLPRFHEAAWSSQAMMQSGAVFSHSRS